MKLSVFLLSKFLGDISRRILSPSGTFLALINLSTNLPEVVETRGPLLPAALLFFLAGAAALARLVRPGVRASVVRGELSRGGARSEYEVSMESSCRSSSTVRGTPSAKKKENEQRRRKANEQRRQTNSEEGTDASSSSTTNTAEASFGGALCPE